MTKYEYKQLQQREFSGYGGFETWEKLGASGWKLMDVKHPQPGQGGCTEYMLMREIPDEKPFRSVFEQVFGSRW